MIKPNLDKIGEMIAEGVKVKDICKAFKISNTTWHKYKVDHPEFGALWEEKRTELVADLTALVEEGLRSKLTYQYKMVEEVKEYDVKLDGSKTLMAVKEKWKLIPPCSTALIYAAKVADPVKFDYDYKLREARKKKVEAETSKIAAVDNTAQLIADRMEMYVPSQKSA